MASSTAAEQQQPQQQQTTLEFYQAMSDFKNMFPQMDDDVIEVFIIQCTTCMPFMYSIFYNVFR